MLQPRRTLLSALAVSAVFVALVAPIHSAQAAPLVTKIMVWGDSMTQVWHQYLSTSLGIRIEYKGVGAESVQQTQVRFNDWFNLASAADRANTGHICWCGHTNFNTTNNNPETIVPTLKAIGDRVPGLFMPIGLMNAPGQGTGTEEYGLIVKSANKSAVNEKMLAAFPTRYAEIRGYLVTAGLRVAGVAATAEDTGNTKVDIPPRSLRTDAGNPSHLNDAGRHVTAERLDSYVRTAGWAPPATNDGDRDGVSNAVDNCPTVPNTNQADTNPKNGIGDACSDLVVASLLLKPATVADEGYGWVTFTINLARPVAIQTSVRYATANGTALAGQDFIAPGTGQRATGTATFAPGDTTEYVFLPVLDDAAVEPDETFTLTLSAPSAGLAIAAASKTATGNIVNNDFSNGNAPTVTVQTPAANATGVGLTSNVKATFSEPVIGVDAGFDSRNFILKNPAGTVIRASVAYNNTNRSATLNPEANLVADTRYTATLVGGPADIRDEAGTPLTTVSWTFLTGPIPKVNATAPANGATGASRTANVTTTFSEVVNGVSGTTFTLTNATTGAVIGAVVSQSGTTNKWILNPSASLAANTKYTITLTGGPTAIRDRAGNPLVTTVRSFTTGA